MEVGDLVKICGVKNIRLGLLIAITPIIGHDTFGFEDWYQCTVLWPEGIIGWEYDIDLEVTNESR